MEPINRKSLKENAKIALKGNFWMVMLVVFVGGILGVGWNGLSGAGGFSNGIRIGIKSTFKNRTKTPYDNFNMEDKTDDADSMKEALEELRDAINNSFSGSDIHFHYDEEKSEQENVSDFLDAVVGSIHLTDEQAGSILVIFGIILLLFLLLYILMVCLKFVLGSFICAPITVGYYRYFMKNRKKEAEFMDLFAVFSNGNYMKVVKVMFSTNIRIWAWSLLFYFPGVVKAYQYYFVSYIMSENPDISMERARELSKRMTDGHKWQIFVLELSFLGWLMVFLLEEVLLAMISCGLLAIPGVLLMYPLIGYQVTTFAELYEERREYALMSGMASGEELVGF